jgi:hypothetical protein
VTGLLAWAALRPTRELHERLALDWSPDLLGDQAARRELQRRFEYQGSDIPPGALDRINAGRGACTRTAR